MKPANLLYPSSGRDLVASRIRKKTLMAEEGFLLLQGDTSLAEMDALAARHGSEALESSRSSLEVCLLAAQASTTGRLLEW
jgi:hypothetical protein